MRDENRTVLSGSLNGVLSRELTAEITLSAEEVAKIVAEFLLKENGIEALGIVPAMEYDREGDCSWNGLKFSVKVGIVKK